MTPIKHCACGRNYTLREWLALPFVGTFDVDCETYELRNCICRSTISIETPVVEETFAPTILIVRGREEVARARVWDHNAARELVAAASVRPPVFVESVQ